MILNKFYYSTSAFFLLSGLFSAHSAHADTPVSPLAAGAEYVALGSSFASGPGIADIIDKGCARSSNNYAQQVARALDLSLTDVTCSGATIANVVDTPQRNHGREIVPPQIDALSESTQLVTITVGGNSFNYSLRTIQAACDATGVFSRAVNKSVLCFMVGQMDTEGSAEALATIDEQLTDMLTKIQAKAPQAKIIFVDYATIFGVSPNGPEDCAANQPIDKSMVNEFIVQADLFATAIEQVTSNLGIELVQLSEVSKDHHVCASTPWITGFEYTTEGVIPYHPTADAMNAAAELVLEALAPTP